MDPNTPFQNTPNQNNPNQNNNNLYQALGVISLILGILALILSVIPCFGTYAIYIAVPGLGCGIAAFMMAKKVNAPIGLATAGMLLAFIGAIISVYQIIKIHEAVDTLDNASRHILGQ